MRMGFASTRHERRRVMESGPCSIPGTRIAREREQLRCQIGESLAEIVEKNGLVQPCVGLAMTRARIVGLHETAHEDDPGVRVPAAEMLGHREAVKLRHHDIEKHAVRLMTGVALHDGEPSRCLHCDYLVASSLHQGSEKLGEHSIIVGYQDTQRAV